MTFKALKLYNLEFTSNVKSTQLSRRPRKSYNPLTSARCARRAILCTVLPKPISSARIPLMPCKKSMNSHFRLTTFLSMQDLKNEATYFLLGLLLRDISYQLHFHSFLGHIFFPLSLSAHHNHTANWICTEQCYLQFTICPKPEIVCNSEKQKSLKCII